MEFPFTYFEGIQDNLFQIKSSRMDVGHRTHKAIRTCCEVVPVITGKSDKKACEIEFLARAHLFIH